MMTAEQYIRVYLDKQIQDNNDDVYASINGVSDVMRMFAIGHVETALKAAHRNMQLPEEDLEFTLGSYPTENIK